MTYTYSYLINSQINLNLERIRSIDWFDEKLIDEFDEKLIDKFDENLIDEVDEKLFDELHYTGSS